MMFFLKKFRDRKMPKNGRKNFRYISLKNSSPTAMQRQDFLNPETLRSVYFKEVEALMKKVIGAKEVFIFNHFLRCNDEESGTNEVGEDNTNGILKR